MCLLVIYMKSMGRLFMNKRNGQFTFAVSRRFLIKNIDKKEVNIKFKNPLKPGGLK